MPDNEYFQGNPIRLETSRSVMRPRPPRWWGSWNVGELVPIFASSLVMPGDTIGQSVTSAIRSVRPVFPVMDNIDITIEAYFVPHRLVMSRKSMSPDINDSTHSWAAFIGAQDSLLNMPTPGDVKLPCLAVQQSSYVVGSLGDCLGYHIPQVGGNSYFVNPLKVLAYYSIWNEYFREPNTMAPVTYSIGSSSSYPTGSYVQLVGSDAGIPSGGSSVPTAFPLAPVCRFHGYFGSALPWPQRNSAQVTLPLGNEAPVYTAPGNKEVPFKSDVEALWFAEKPGTGDTSWTHDQNFDGQALRLNQAGEAGIASNGAQDVTDVLVVPTNLFADLATATAASVNQFRLAVQTQRWYEHLARSGNKYSDLVHGMFGVRGVSIPDRPEYLGGFTMPLSMSQVAQTTDGSQNDGLGKVGAFSLSNPGGYLYSKSFTEHGTVMVVMCCRINDSFSQGIAREDTKFDRFDYYWPEFANLGEQPLLKKEIYVTGSSTDDEVFGYQEAWAEYRMFNDFVTGYMNPDVSQSLEFATYSNVFNGVPSLKSFLSASKQKDNVDRTLAVASSSAGFQFYGEFYFPTKMVRPMPLYSIPGLVDHH